jgi:xylan 1,4-beta-xylosidase
MLEQLLDHRLDATVSGDGAGDMVQAVASRDDAGRVTVVAWNGTVDVTKAGGATRLDRSVHLAIEGMQADRYRLRHRRLDEGHSNLVRQWNELAAGAEWPTEEQWSELAARDALDDFETERVALAEGGRLELAFDLPMPSVSLIELVPTQSVAGRRRPAYG